MRERAGEAVCLERREADDDASRVREAYPDQTYRRLAEVKAQYDPELDEHLGERRDDRRRLG
jgi:hypothetical protein